MMATDGAKAGAPGDEALTRRLPGDAMTGTDPVSFALDFTRKMRAHAQTTHVPSMRTSLAIPRLLSARVLRLGAIGPNDYIEAAVMCTPPEDQALGWQVARDLLFPPVDPPPAKAGEVDAAKAAAAVTAQVATPPKPRSILEDLAALNLDLDSLDDLSSLDKALEAVEDAEMFGALDVMEQLGRSQDPADAALAQLLSRYGGADALQGRGIDAKEGAADFAHETLRGRMGALMADEVAEASRAGFSKTLLKESATPWELAGALAGAGDLGRLERHVADLLAGAGAVELGRTMQFLEPHAGVLKADELVAFRELGRQRAQDLGEHGELLDGLGSWLPPADGLLERSTEANPLKAMDAARIIDGRFREGLQQRVFDHWADARTTPPTLAELLDLRVDSPRWEAMAEEAHRDWARALDAEAVAGGVALKMAVRLEKLETKLGKALAAETFNAALEAVEDPERFLPTLDQFVEERLFPARSDDVVAAGVKLGIDPKEVLSRLGRPVEQLQALIAEDSRNIERYASLVKRIGQLPKDVLAQLVAQCLQNGNHAGMAACLAIDLGGAAALASALGGEGGLANALGGGGGGLGNGQGGGGAGDFVMASLGYKGIGGGTNLLQQWFDHRQTLESGLRDKIKAIARKALIDLAIEAAARGSGNTEQGLIPQTQTRPFRGGDELEQLDVEATLDAIISAGKTLDQVTLDDLFVPTTSRGRAAFVLLVDISSSMYGRELANCAIAAAMLILRLAPEEIALAFFESDTHVVKGFLDTPDMEAVADRVLDLEATGGTCVDAALGWTVDQLATVPEAELRLLVMLSDFHFSESVAALAPRLEALASAEVRFLGGAHGSFSEATATAFCQHLRGESLKLRDLDKLPAFLQDVIERVASDL
jgi:Mg-chelatase subunit ChlD